MAEIYDYSAGFDDPSNKNAWFAKILGTNKRIFEVGCATGYVGEYMVEQLKCKVWGCEYVAKAAELARARGCYEEVVVGDIQDASTLSTLQKGGFDFIMFADVLEHLASPESALENIKPLLAPDGHVLICVPSIIHWSIRRDILFGRFEYTDTGPLDRTHIHFFTPSSAKKLVTDCGFRIVNQSGVVWLPRVLYRLPQGLRLMLERIARAIDQSAFDGQTLLDITLASD
jgi:SAM-dependent methyltransferase